MKIFLSILIVLCTFFTGYGQELDYAIKLKLKPQTDKNYLATRDAEIIRLASKHAATITQSWFIPNSPPELYLYYDLRLKGSTSKESRASFIKDFLATGKFESDVYEYYCCVNF